MTRNQIVRKIANETNTRQADIKRIIYAYEDTIIESLLNGEEVKLQEFVSFRIKKHVAKVYYNPMNGQKRKLKPKFKVKAILSENLQNEIEDALYKKNMEIKEEDNNE